MLFRSWAQDTDHSLDAIDKSDRVLELINSYRVHGHLMADVDPLEFVMRSHPDLDVGSHGLSLWDLDRTFATGGFGGKPFMKLREILGILYNSSAFPGRVTSSEWSSYTVMMGGTTRPEVLALSDAEIQAQIEVEFKNWFRLQGSLDHLEITRCLAGQKC